MWLTLRSINVVRRFHKPSGAGANPAGATTFKLCAGRSIADRLTDTEEVDGAEPSRRTIFKCSRGVMYSAPRFERGGCRRNSCREYHFGLQALIVKQPAFNRLNGEHYPGRPPFPSRLIAGYLTLNQRIVVRVCVTGGRSAVPVKPLNSSTDRADLHRF